MDNRQFKFNDYNTELIFSLLRWIFLIGAIFLFYFPPLAKELDYSLTTFNVLLVVGFLYMGITQIALYFLSENKQVFSFLTKAGVVFDYIAFNWLLLLSGGVESLLFPIAYLIVMHSTIYWRIAGAIISIASVLTSYTVILLIEYSSITAITFIQFILNISFLLILGLFGSLIVYRERKHQSEKNTYKTLVQKDFLTNLYNHRHFQEHLIDCTKKDTVMTLAMMDIDHFKKINDTFGHVIGDMVLKKVGEILENTIPKGKGLAFRYGGEEFALLFYTADLNEVKAYISSINKVIHKTKFNIEDESFTITISVGVASINKKKENQLVKLADSLLYKAKKLGRNQAVFEDGSVLKNYETI